MTKILNRDSKSWFNQFKYISTKDHSYNEYFFNRDSVLWFNWLRYISTKEHQWNDGNFKQILNTYKLFLNQNDSFQNQQFDPYTIRLKSRMNWFETSNFILAPYAFWNKEWFDSKAMIQSLYDTICLERKMIWFETKQKLFVQRDVRIGISINSYAWIHPSFQEI